MSPRGRRQRLRRLLGKARRVNGTEVCVCVTGGRCSDTRRGQCRGRELYVTSHVPWLVVAVWSYEGGECEFVLSSRKGGGVRSPEGPRGGMSQRRNCRDFFLTLTSTETRGRRISRRPCSRCSAPTRSSGRCARCGGRSCCRRRCPCGEEQHVSRRTTAPTSYSRIIL